ncbi:Hypothetical predicted protein [Cloeon dipterum]|uniref:C2H2-type domain-containing protein n=1 Tax=Cloeon dipterum TaxID=197152 RepID=A0A8S1CLJ1_9INSE|nr:Hypothetical predicted protein [Cloeon dipterum]
MLPQTMSFEEVLLVDATVVLNQFSVDDENTENTITGNSNAVDPIQIQISVSPKKQTQEFNCSSQPMVLDVDLNSIMQNGSSGKQKTKEGKKIRKNSPNKNCSKFPRKLKNNSIQLMQEKPAKRKEKNKPEEKTRVEQTPAPAAKESLLCKDCNTSFSTSVAKNHALAYHGNLGGGVCCGKHFAMDELVQHKQLIHGAVSEVHSVIEIEIKERCQVLDVAMKRMKYGDFQCSLCSFSAYSWTALSDHRQKIHKEKA